MLSTFGKAGFLKGVQLLLSFASVCAVVEASRVESPPNESPGYYATQVPFGREPPGDRRIGDLARLERKRREAVQQASRQRVAPGHVRQHRRLLD